MGIPLGVLLNRSDLGDDEVPKFCAAKGIPLLAKIPHDRDIAEGYARGDLLVTSAPKYIRVFLELFVKIQELVAKGPDPRRQAAV